MTTVNVSPLLSLDESRSIVYALVNIAEVKADKKYLDVATTFTTQSGNGLDEYFQGLIDELDIDYTPNSVTPVPFVEPIVDAPSEPVTPESPTPVVEPSAVTPEPVATEPVATEPVATEPVATEPVATEPVATEPVATEPVAIEPVATPVTESSITEADLGVAPSSSSDPAIVAAVQGDPVG
jgi:hypothetical protein